MNPTGSFKDTGMTAALSVAKERGFEWVACASTGTLRRDGGIRGTRWIAQPGFDSRRENRVGKLSQAMDYGAVTCQLKTDFDGCVKVLAEIVREEPIYLLNSVNPYRLEGQKTPAFEIAEALEWTVPTT